MSQSTESLPELELADVNDDVRERWQRGDVAGGGIARGSVEDEGVGAVAERTDMGRTGTPALVIDATLPGLGTPASDAAFARGEVRACVRTGSGGGSASSDFARTVSVDAVERRRASRADTGRTTPSALSPSLEKRGAADWVSQFSSGFREVDGARRTGEPVRGSTCSKTLLRAPVECALGVGELGRDIDFGLALPGEPGERVDGGDTAPPCATHAGKGGTAGGIVRALADLERFRAVRG